MKRVRIVSGIRTIEDSDSQTTLLKLRDILAEHRSALVGRVASDLPTYIDYRFKTRVNSRQLDHIKDGLYSLRNSVLDLERYSDIVEDFFSNEMTYIGSERFFREIDESISSILNSSQLTLVPAS